MGSAENRPAEDRRREDRRKLFNKPFLAMLAGALPEDRRKGERRGAQLRDGSGADSVPTVRGDDDTQP